jgi:hypothetical protein
VPKNLPDDGQAELDDAAAPTVAASRLFVEAQTH